jgi:hypothetical protein
MWSLGLQNRKGACDVVTPHARFVRQRLEARSGQPVVATETPTLHLFFELIKLLTQSLVPGMAAYTAAASAGLATAPAPALGTAIDGFVASMIALHFNAAQKGVRRRSHA